MRGRGDHAATRQRYLTGYAVCLVLTCLSFGALWFAPFDRAATLATIAVAAILQILAQLRYFLHVDLSRQKREDLQLMLFTALILAIMVGGTVWILANQMSRMMG